MRGDACEGGCQGRRVAVTGLGMVTGLGLDVSDSWLRALAGECAIRRIEGAEVSGSPVPAAGVVSEADKMRIRETYPSEAAEFPETRTLFALWAAGEAVSDAGPAVGGDGSGVALAAGVGVTRMEDISAFITGRSFDYTLFEADPGRVHPQSILRNPSHAPVSCIARRFGLGGPQFTVTTACASASQAVGLAFRAVREGRADAMLAGGADSMVNPVGLAFFPLLGASSPGGERPEESCRPFDRRRSGLVMGEGAGFVVLEERGRALGRGARIYAELAGYGTSMDAYQATAPRPDGSGAARAMAEALRDAGMAPGDVDYINAHGTSTKLNDIAETVAIRAVFGDHAPKLAVSSSKSVFGHLIAAAGGPELVFTVLSVYYDQVHATLNLTQPDPKCGLDYVALKGRATAVRAALSNSFGFGGQNASLAVRKMKG